ncbi:MAG: hydroxymethylbilane synthase [Proteobacteria bacterium]|nr:hydroxymethylbilane synthase [Pseudomonadota bacterium]NOG60591.1 hydroxymethylbilane synthase [Pseudomonadota bacterium]
MKTLKIATRKSPLALWQAEHVKKCLLEAHSDLSVELVKMQTEGDRFLDAPLIAVGGKGLFIKELEQALLEGKADIAVHSMKDVTIDLPEKLVLPVIMEREDTRDVFISNTYDKIEDLPENAVMGTSSLRRQSQVKALHPGIELKDLRGNVGTRLGKLDAGEYDAIMLAAAGIIRLGMSERITQLIPPSILLPAIGQGAVGIECRAGDDVVHELIAPLNHQDTSVCVQTERAFSRRLFGGCQLPIAGQATIAGDEINLTGLIARVDGSEVIKAEQKGNIADIDNIGITLAEALLERGGDKILEELLH